MRAQRPPDRRKRDSDFVCMHLCRHSRARKLFHESFPSQNAEQSDTRQHDWSDLREGTNHITSDCQQCRLFHKGTWGMMMGVPKCRHRRIHGKKGAQFLMHFHEEFSLKFINSNANRKPDGISEYFLNREQNFTKTKKKMYMFFFKLNK